MPDWERSYTLRADRVKTLTAIDVPAAETADILAKLGFGMSGSGPWTATVPSWRPDIIGEADLVEEVTRVHGFDHIPTTSLPALSATSKPVRTPMQRRAPQARRALAARGMNEAVTWSFLPRKQAERFGGGAEDLRLLNSIDATLDTMRPSILPNLIDAAARNEARGLSDPALFEVGPQYKDATPTGQRTMATGLRHHMAVPRNWAGPARTVDAFDAKADALAVLAAIGAPDTLSAQSGAPDWYHPGRSGALKLGDRVMAYFGELHPEIVAAADLKGPVAAFEVFLDAPPLPKAKASKARPKLVLSPFQPRRARFRLPGRCRGRCRQARPRRAQRRQGADHRRAGVRPLCRQGRARGQEVARHRRHPAAGRAHAHRCGDRGRLEQDRGAGRESDRRRTSWLEFLSS